MIQINGRIRGFSAFLALLLVLLAVAVVVPGRIQAAAADYDIDGGHFYTQAAGGAAAGAGYAIQDTGKDSSGHTVSLWSEFKRLGGVAALGYPASNRFVWNGFVCQVTQRFVLQWRPEVNKVYFVNVMDLITQMGKDGYLASIRETPPPANFGAEEKGMSFGQIVAKRYKLLDAYPAIKAKYFSVSDPLNLNGLPTAPVTDTGDVIVLRAQRIIIQQWKNDMPWAKKGQITVALGGDIAKEVGLIASVDPLSIVPKQPQLSQVNKTSPTQQPVSKVNPTATPVSKPSPTPVPVNKVAPLPANPSGNATSPTNQTNVSLPSGSPQQCANARFVIPSKGILGTTYRQPGAGEAGFSDMHTGIDILGTLDDDVYAAADGLVTYSVFPRIQIWHQELGVETYYTHLSKVFVKQGDVVKKGSVIGKKGNTNTGGVILLHFSVKKKSMDERYIANTFDPSTFLNANVNYDNGARQWLHPVAGWCRP